MGIVARGDVFTVPVEHGVTRDLTQSSSAHDREIAWSSDGKRLAYVSDRSGEEEIYVQAQDGSDAGVQVTSGSVQRYYAPRWSGDDKRIAFCDNTGRLYVIEVATRRRIAIARDPADLPQDYRWSPDGRYLAYSLDDSNGFTGVYVWSAADGQSRRITPPLFNAHSPAWAPDGELLYYLSEREYQPLLSTIEFDFATDRQTGIFAVTLRKDGRNPFGIRDDEPGDAKKDAEKDTVAAGDGDKASGKEKKKSAGGAHSQTAMKIDFEGIEQRVIRVPLEADNLSDLEAGAENLLYQRNGPAYYGRDSSVKPSVMSYSIKGREAKTVAEDVTEWSATADGKHVLAQLASKEIKYYEVGADDDAKDDDDAKTVSLAGLVTTRVPAAEWREIFAEVWRRYRDYFYVENMHGYDWKKLREKYEPLLDFVGSRADLNYVIAEMISELTVQHAYIEGGDLGLPKRPYVALPGARFELDAKSGRYRIAKIFAGQNEEERYRSPLTEVGVDAHVGDYVLAINGRELKAGTDPYELLQAVPNQPVEWRVSPRADGTGAHTIRYRPLTSENDLLYLAWVAGNRARVDRMSQGRLGYIHVPDMGEAGIREFIKWWYPQVRKEGLVVDVRDNGGGNISELLIERLSRTLHGTTFARNHEAADTYPRVVQPGPKVALINEDTSSDGDIFAYAFRQWKIGTLVGKRTWGGAVGITDHGPLLDGGVVFVPEFGTADENGRWIIEGHGVDPDIVVEQDPVEVLKGRDPQLERGVQELMKVLPPALRPACRGRRRRPSRPRCIEMSELATLGLARATDAREVAEMSRDLIEQGLTWSWTPARVQHFITGPESSVVVARRERRIAAFAIMHFGDDVAHLNLLAVAPEHRRQGLGRRLMGWLTETAIEAGVFRINLELRLRNEPARIFYERLGFDQLGSRARVLSRPRAGAAHVSAPGEESSLSRAFEAAANQDRCGLTDPRNRAAGSADGFRCTETPPRPGTRGPGRYQPSCRRRRRAPGRPRSTVRTPTSAPRTDSIAIQSLRRDLRTTTHSSFGVCVTVTAADCTPECLTTLRSSSRISLNTRTRSSRL